MDRDETLQKDIEVIERLLSDPGMDHLTKEKLEEYKEELKAKGSGK